MDADPSASLTPAPPSPPQAYLIVGLGNPGREYKATRHNIGFMLVDQLAGRLGASFGRMESRALVAKGSYQDRRIVLAKPQTFMNLSGQAVSALRNYYKVPLANLLVVYDEVDLPSGVLRLRARGGSAGHNGMRSIIEKLGSQDFPRLRIGIGRPPGRMDAAAYVLQDFGRDERLIVEAALDRAVQATLTFIESGIQAAMNNFNAAENDQG
jgi:PTH1 family peptidyl-tRNA hydrolase